jgi:hypothetical protein
MPIVGLHAQAGLELFIMCFSEKPASTHRVKPEGMLFRDML